MCFFMPLEDGDFTGHSKWSAISKELYENLLSKNFTLCESENKLPRL